MSCLAGCMALCCGCLVLSLVGGRVLMAVMLPPGRDDLILMMAWRLLTRGLPRSTPPPVSFEPAQMDTAVALAGQASPERLMADLEWLADDARQGRKLGSPAEDAVGGWLVERFQELGLGPLEIAGLDSYIHRFADGSGQAVGENIIAVLPGAGDTQRCVMIAAHYDHIGVTSSGQVYNGADDDASGVAAMLEAARILSQANPGPQETIILVAFSGEEAGLLGSGSFAELARREGLQRRCELLNLEVLGAAKGQGTYLDIWDEMSRSTARLVEAVKLSGQALDIEVRQQGLDPGSDALTMIAGGLPSATLSVAWSYETHPHYHSTSDDADNIDPDGFLQATRAAIAAVWLLANDGH